MLLKGFFIKNGSGFIVLLLLFFSIALKFHNLDEPDSYYFDEVYYAFTIQEMAKGNRDSWEMWSKAPEGFAFEWSHPPLGKEISVLGLLIFGDNTFAWRFFQALFGGLGTLFIYLLGKNLFQSSRVGIFASFLFTFDSFIFVLSRITMVDIFLVDFIILASLFLVKYARSQKFYFLLISGLFCGFSMSVKWIGIYVTEFLGAVALVLLYYNEIYGEPSKGGKLLDSSYKIIPRVFLAFVIIPLIVYVLTYIPYFLNGHGIGDFIDLQKGMFGYHKSITQTHPYQSPWWKWPLMLKTVYLYLGDYIEKDKHRYIYAIGNPFIWWTGCVFFVLGIIQVLRKELPSLAFALFSVFAYWLPWAFSPRKVTFLYHFLPSFIFVLLISGYFLNLVWERLRYGRVIVLSYLFIAFLMFFYFYPITAAIPVADSSLWRYFWLSSWR